MSQNTPGPPPTVGLGDFQGFGPVKGFKLGNENSPRGLYGGPVTWDRCLVDHHDLDTFLKGISHRFEKYSVWVPTAHQFGVTGLTETEKICKNDPRRESFMAQTHAKNYGKKFSFSMGLREHHREKKGKIQLEKKLARGWPNLTNLHRQLGPSK